MFSDKCFKEHAKRTEEAIEGIVVSSRVVLFKEVMRCDRKAVPNQDGESQPAPVKGCNE